MENRRGGHVCPYCGKTFARAGGLIRHREYVHQRHRYTCHVCGRGYSRSDDLKTHVRNAHGDIPAVVIPPPPTSLTSAGKAETKLQIVVVILFIIIIIIETFCLYSRPPLITVKSLSCSISSVNGVASEYARAKQREEEAAV
jgi:uncharacterized C2H2 Zn-finger protein